MTMIRERERNTERERGRERETEREQGPCDLVTSALNFQGGRENVIIMQSGSLSPVQTSRHLAVEYA